MGPPCSGSAGYSDIAIGGGVTVYDGAGIVIGTGAIDSCTDTDGTTGATFTFQVHDVPTGKAFYQYEITHRGKLAISEADALAGSADATLGD